MHVWRCRGQYSDAVLNELESQNDDQVAGIMGKVKILKEVSQGRPASPRGASSLSME
jgi:blocked early in transport 1